MNTALSKTIRDPWIRKISHDLQEDAEAYRGLPSLPKGIGGPILYFAYLYRYTGDDHYRQQVNELTSLYKPMRLDRWLFLRPEGKEPRSA